MPRHTDRRNRSNNSAQPLTRWVPRQLEQLEDRLTPSAVLSNTPNWIDVGPNNISGGQSTNITGAVNSTATITTATQAAGVATITTTAPVGLTVGGGVTITGVDVNEFNGRYRVTSVAGNTFTYNLILTPASNGTGGTASASNSSAIGAVQAITPDLSDFSGNTLYAGGVNGGVWKTTNGLSATPNWVPLTDNYPSLSVSTISINPDNNQQILVGIGGNSDGVYTINASTGARISLDSRGGARGDLAGALLSNDGGQTWSILSDKIGGQNVIGVAARGTTAANSYLLVATDGGLYRSTAGTSLANLGKTFTQITGGTTGLPAGGIFDLAADPGAPVSVVSDATWNGSEATITTVNPHALSVGQRVVVAAVSSTGGSAVGFNGTFAVTAVTANTFTYSLITDPGTYVSGGTANSDLTLDPLARNRFYIAVKSGTGPGTVGASSTQSIFRSDNGGLTWGNVQSPNMSIGAKTTNIQIAVFNSGIITNNIVYVAVQNNNPTGAEANTTGFNYGWANRGAAVSTISWSPNQGATWTRMDVPRTITNAQNATFSYDGAGVVTVSTGVRHHLRNGDLVQIVGVTDNGDPAATNPTIPPALIGAINGFRTVTVTSESTFTLDGVNFSGQPYDFLYNIRTNPGSGYRQPMGTWAQVLGASGGERPEFFDLVADRSSSNIVYLGTDRAAASSGDGFGSQFYPNGGAGPTTFTTNIWKGDRLVNPSNADPFAGPVVSQTRATQWTTLVNSGTGNGSAPSADVRDLAIGSNGQLIAATGTGLFLLPSPNPVSSSVANATWSALNGGVATITTSLPHNFTINQTVTISNIASAVLAPAGAPNGYNGSFTITGTTATSFTYALAANPGQFISTDSVVANVATVQMAVPHGYTVGQNVTIIGVVPGTYNGTFQITGTPGATTISAPDTITNATWAAGSATITTSSLNGVQVNQQVTISGVSVAGYNGTFTVATVSPGTNQFTYAVANPATLGAGGTQQNATDAIASAIWSAGTATITTTAAHNMFTGQTVTIAGVAVPGYNVTRTITVTSATTFEFSLVVDPGNSAGAGGTARTAAINISGATWSTAAGGTATITTASNPGVIVGDSITIAGVAIPVYNGTFTVTAVSGNDISYALATPPANATGGTATPVTGTSDIITAAWAGNVATITTQNAHNYSVGERVVIAGILSTGPGTYNGTVTLLSASGNTLTYSLGNDPGITTRTRPTSFTHNLNATLPATTTSNNALVNGAVAGGTNWNTINGNLSVTNVASVAYDLQSNRVFAGTIDTGAIVQNSTGGNAYSTVFSATNTRDSFFDQASVLRVISDNSLLNNAGILDGLTKRYYVGTNFSNIRRETVNASGVVTSFSNLLFRDPINQAASGLSGADQLANATETIRIAMALNQNDPRRAMFGYNDLYEDADPSGSTPTGQIVNTVTPAGKTGTIESILYGGKRGGVNYNQIAYVTTTTGQLWIRDEFGGGFVNVAGNLTAVSGVSGAIYSVVSDPDDYRHFFVAQGDVPGGAIGSRILEIRISLGGAVSVVDITDNLIGPAIADGTAGPGKLTTEIRTLAVYDTNVGAAATDDLTLIAGGRGGVYRLQTNTKNNGGSWTEYGQALPNTVVNDVQLYNNQRIVGGTGGRGIWSIPDISPTIAAESVLTVDGTAGDDVITVSLDPNNSNVILVWDGFTETSWTRGSFSKLQLNGFGGADTIIIDSTIDRLTHVPIAGGNVDFVNFGISVNGGGDAGDTLRIIADGTTTNRTINISNTTISGPLNSTLFAGTAKVDYTGLNLGVIEITTGSGNDTFNVTALMPGQTRLRGGAGNDTYNVVTNPASPAVVDVNDTAGTDTLVVNGTAAADTFGITATQVTTGTNTVSYAGIETFSVNGLGAGDTFNITSAGGTTNTFDGGAGDDTYNITLNPASTTTYTVADTGATGTDTLNVTGTSGNDTFGVTATQVVLGTNTVAYSGIENLNVRGIDGNDTYNITGAGGTTNTFDGGLADDTYNITLNPASTTTYTVADTGATGTDTLNLTGTSGNDTFGVTATQVVLGTNTAAYSGIEALNVLGIGGNDTYNITGAGGTTNTFDGAAGNDTYNVTLDPASTTTYTVADTGATGTDTLNATGTSGNDTIGVTATQITSGTNTIAYSGIETLNVLGIGGNDTFNITGAGGTTNTFDGGAADDTYNITLNPASTTTYTVADTGATGTDTLNVTGTSGNDTFGVTATQVVLGTNTVAYSGIEALNVLGIGGNDTYNITGAGGTINTFDGATGDDTYNITLNPASTTTYTVADTGATGTDTLNLTGTSGNDTFGVTATQVVLGTNTAAYSGIEALNVLGIGGNDTYNITGAGGTTNTFDGAAGNDTYNVTLDPASTTTYTVADTGATGTDTLNATGTSGNDTIGVTATQITSGTNTIAYSGIETLNVLGIGGNDTFNITGAGGTTNTFDGGAADDTYNITLNPASTTTYTVADTGATGTDTLNVTGTSGNDTFGVTATQVVLGTNTVAYSGIEALNVLGIGGNDTYNITGAGGTINTFDGATGDDTYNITLNPASTTTYTVADTGATGTDTLNLTGTAGNDTFGVTATQVVLGTNTAAYSGIEALNVLGIGGNDTYNITGAGGTTNTFDGAAGNDTYNVTLDPASTTTYTVADTGATGTDTLNATGTAAADAFTISPTQVVLGTQTINYTAAIETLNVAGAGSDDTFALATQGASANTAVIIDGGTGNDTFSVTGTSAADNIGVDITSGAGNGGITGLPQSIAFISVQAVNVDGAAGANSLTWRDQTNVSYGTALNPETGVIYRPSGATSGLVQIGNGSAFPTVAFTNINGNFVANGDPDSSGDRDVFTELGYSTTGQQSVGPFGELTAANGADTFTVTDKSITMTNATLGAMRRVDFGLNSSGAPTFSTIHIRGGNETVNGDQFTATPSLLANIVINGMDPTSGASADSLLFISNGTTVTFPTTNTIFGAPQTRMVQTVDNRGLGFYNIENVNVFDPNYGTPPLLTVNGTANTNEGAVYTLTLGAVNDPGRIVTQYIVNWGDGSSNTYATSGAKTHVYADGPNNFVITVDLVDQFGLHTAVGNPPNKSIAVLNVAPTIAVSTGQPVGEGSISSITLGAVSDPGQDTVTTYIVHWGDGFTDTYPTNGVKTHRYAGSGNYGVTVDLIDEDGNFVSRGSTTVSVVSQELFNGSKLNLTAAAVGPFVVVYNSDGSTRFILQPYPGYTGNITVATGDINGDGVDEIVTGTESLTTHVKVFDGATGAEISSFIAYPGLNGGVSVAVGDVLGRGYAQVVTGTGFGGAPHVKVFDVNRGLELAASYFAYDPAYLGGVNVAAGRLDGSGHDLIVTGAGVGGRSHVKAFDVAYGGVAEQRSFFAFDEGFSGGVNVAAGQGVIVVAPTIGASSNVIVIRYADLARIQSFIAFPNYDILPSYNGGARVAIGSRNGVSTLLASSGSPSPGSIAPPRFRIYRLSDLATLSDSLIGDPAFNGGVYVG